MDQLKVKRKNDEIIIVPGTLQKIPILNHQLYRPIAIWQLVKIHKVFEVMGKPRIEFDEHRTAEWCESDQSFHVIIK